MVTPTHGVATPRSHPGGEKRGGFTWWSLCSKVPAGEECHSPASQLLGRGCILTAPAKARAPEEAPGELDSAPATAHNPLREPYAAMEMLAADMGLTSATSLAFCRASFWLAASSISSSSCLDRQKCVASLRVLCPLRCHQLFRLEPLSPSCLLSQWGQEASSCLSTTHPRSRPPCYAHLCRQESPGFLCQHPFPGRSQLTAPLQSSSPRDPFPRVSLYSIKMQTHPSFIPTCSPATQSTCHTRTKSPLPQGAEPGRGAGAPP